MTLPLFGEPSRFDRERLRRKLEALARDRIFIGTSSWKYEGWLGQIYTEGRYLSRGRFARKRFEAECLAEYAETFPIVCGDFTFYQFPSQPYWSRLFGSAPASLQYAFKVPEDITVKVFPIHPRYGPRAGEPNQTFLDADAFQKLFLDLIAPWRKQVAVLIFEFGAFPRRCYGAPGEFLDELAPFLSALPRQYRYAVEIRNPEFLGPEYFGCLREHGVAHVLNAWTRMPAIAEQIALPGVHTADFSVVRALLCGQRTYEQAVAQFSPYHEIRDPDYATRRSLTDVIDRARERHEPSYIFVNNRLEGNAPETIQAITD